MNKNKLPHNLAKISTALYVAFYVFIHSSKVYAISIGFRISDTLKVNTLGEALKTCSAKPDLEGVRCFVVAVTNFALDVMGALAFIMILYASIIYLISYGDEAKAEIAKKTLIWSVIGIIAVAAAKAVLYIIHDNFK